MQIVSTTSLLIVSGRRLKESDDVGGDETSALWTLLDQAETSLAREIYVMV